MITMPCVRRLTLLTSTTKKDKNMLTEKDLNESLARAKEVSDSWNVNKIKARLSLVKHYSDEERAKDLASFVGAMIARGDILGAITYLTEDMAMTKEKKAMAHVVKSTLLMRDYVKRENAKPAVEDAADA